MASFAYAAPEQLTGGPLDGRADVYSLGAVLFELLTGRRAFDAESLPALLYTVVNAPPPDIRAVRPDFPPALSAVLARALAKDPAHRFRSCAELVSAARACWPVRRPASETVVGQRGCRRHHHSHGIGPGRRPAGDWLLAGLGASLAVVLVVTSCWCSRRGGQTRTPVPGRRAARRRLPVRRPRSGPMETPATWATWSSSSTTFRACCRPPRTAKDGTGPPARPTAFAGDVHADVGLTCQSRTASRPRLRTIPTSRLATRDGANSKRPTRRLP